MLNNNTLSTIIQIRVDGFINERLADKLSRKDALEVLAEYVELKTGEKINSSYLKNWLYEGASVPTTKLLAITKTFSG